MDADTDDDDGPTAEDDEPEYHKAANLCYCIVCCGGVASLLLGAMELLYARPRAPQDVEPSMRTATAILEYAERANFWFEMRTNYLSGKCLRIGHGERTYGGITTSGMATALKSMPRVCAFRPDKFVCRCWKPNVCSNWT